MTTFIEEQVESIKDIIQLKKTKFYSIQGSFAWNNGFNNFSAMSGGDVSPFNGFLIVHNNQFFYLYKNKDKLIPLKAKQIVSIDSKKESSYNTIKEIIQHYNK